MPAVKESEPGRGVVRRIEGVVVAPPKIRSLGDLKLDGAHGMVQVGLGELTLVDRNGPSNAKHRVGKVHEGVGLLELGRPVGVHEIGVGGAVLQRLEGVAHAPWHEDGLGGVERTGEDLAEGLAARTEIDPRAEDGAASDGDELVPCYF